MLTVKNGPPTFARPPPPRPPPPRPAAPQPQCVKVGYDRMELRIDGRVHTLTRLQAMRLLGELERCASDL